MAKVTVTPNGVKISRKGGGNSQPKERGECKGWSVGAARRNSHFLMSIDAAEMVGRFKIVSFSLTIGEIPATSDDWQKVRRAFLKRLDRMGMVGFHWLTEWQRRGAPHLHGVALFPASDTSNLTDGVTYHWLQASSRYSSGVRSQHAVFVHSLTGWLQYLGKHGARGVNHYQRSSAHIPQGWAKTGRLWGQGGDWPTMENPFEISDEGLSQFRRFLRNYNVAQVRADLLKERDTAKRASLSKRLSYCRRMLKCNKPVLSFLMGRSEWIPEDLTMRWLAERHSRLGDVRAYADMSPPDAETSNIGAAGGRADVR